MYAFVKGGFYEKGAGYGEREGSGKRKEIT